MSNDVGQNIKNRRLHNEKTLKEMADYIGVTEATAQRYESGNIKNIPYQKIVAISNFLNCKPTDLMGWAEELPSYSVKAPEFDPAIILLIDSTREIIHDKEMMARVFAFIEAMNPNMHETIREALRKYYSNKD